MVREWKYHLVSWKPTTKQKELFNQKEIIVSMVNSQLYLKRFERYTLITDPIGKSGRNWSLFQLFRWRGKELRWNSGFREGDLLSIRKPYQIHCGGWLTEGSNKDIFHFRWIELCERLKGVTGFPDMEWGTNYIAKQSNFFKSCLFRPDCAVSTNVRFRRFWRFLVWYLDNGSQILYEIHIIS
jgi:hypothetical protein